METLFTLGNLLALPFWLLMIVLPHWRWTLRIMRSPLVIALPALLYAALVLPQIGDLLPALMNPTLSGVAGLLGTPGGALIGWIHFLAFDLFVGRWAYLDSRASAISTWLMAAVLFAILMFGPLGFVIYLLVRAIWLRVWPRESAPLMEGAV